MFKLAKEQHDGVRAVVEPIPLAELRWSLICVATMQPSNPNQGLFGIIDTPKPHNLLLKATSPPAWQSSWLSKVPFVGSFLILLLASLSVYVTKYEDVADFLAEDLEKGGDEWVGKKVGMKDKAKMKEA